VLPYPVAQYRERCSPSIHVTALSFLSKSESQVSATADTSTNSIAFFAQILSLLLPISIDKLTGMLANCGCLPHTQSGGTQQGIVLKRGILTAVSSVELNQCIQIHFSHRFCYSFADTVQISTHLNHNRYPPCQVSAFTTTRPVSSAGPSGSTEKSLSFFGNHFEHQNLFGL
jgi:hypothetical protein